MNKLLRFIERANTIHNNKYDYSLVEYNTCKTKVKIICPIHGIFLQTPNNHTSSKSSCPLCSKQKHTKDLKSVIEDFKKIHNDKYDYSLIKYVNSYTKVKIICPVHGKFLQTPNAHLNGHGCPKCSKNSINDEKMFIDSLRLKHNDKYDYSKVEYKGRAQKICIVCLIHGSFWQLASAHLSGQGCPKCAKQRRALKRTKNQEDFVKQAQDKHNNKYDYSKIVYNNCRIKIKIICPIHGEFLQKPYKHLRGTGCPLCSHNNISKAEKKIVEFIRQHYKGVVYENDRKILDGKEIDIYLPELNLAFEYNGLRWHGDDKLNKTYHLDKTESCEQKGIQLVHIWEDDWNFKQDKVKSYIYYLLKATKQKNNKHFIAKKIEEEDSKIFLNTEHLQSYGGGSIHIGLFDNGILIAVMSFAHLKSSSKKERAFIMLRFCYKTKFAVEAANKMLNFFTNKYKPKKIISYVDRCWSPIGAIYKQMGMKIIIATAIKYKYYRRIKRENYQQFQKRGFTRIYDCGQLKFCWIA